MSHHTAVWRVSVRVVVGGAPCPSTRWCSLTTWAGRDVVRPAGLDSARLRAPRYGVVSP